MLTSEETADLFGISMETLRMWQETGVLLPIKTEKKLHVLAKCNRKISRKV